MSRNTRTILIVLACCVGGLVFGALMRWPGGSGVSGNTDMAVFRRNAAETGRASCFRTARAGVPASVPDDRITDYCGCATDQGIAALTDDQLRMLDRGGSATPEISDKLSSAAKACQPRLVP